MRLEIVIPDSTRPDIQARLVTLTQKLSAQPDLVNSLTLEEPLVLTPDQISAVRRSQAEFAEGKGLSASEARSILDEHRRAWLDANPS